MKYLGVVAVTLIVWGLGFAMGRWSVPSGPAPLQDGQRAALPDSNGPARGGQRAVSPEQPVLEQSDAMKLVSNSGLGRSSVYYPKLFAFPPALEIVDDYDPPLRFRYQIQEQRQEGFVINVSACPTDAKAKPLRYIAKGMPFDGALTVQEGEGIVPLARKVDGKLLPGELEVFYRMPFISPPHLTFPDGISCRVLDQKVTGFRVETESSAGSPISFRWRAELITKK